MFCLDNVTKVYSRRGTELTAIRTESLSLATGSYTAIVGPSGSGKTTLLSLLGGMLSPTSAGGRVARWMGMAGRAVGRVAPITHRQRLDEQPEEPHGNPRRRRSRWWRG